MKVPQWVVGKAPERGLAEKNERKRKATVFI